MASPQHFLKSQLCHILQLELYPLKMHGYLRVPRVVQSRIFSYQALLLRNLLPNSVQDTDTPSTVKIRLETFFFDND